ncbi:MAG: hypothetical protein H7222_07590 [Methylotenera sp.]|nr:hypothetical protein [Oligoflexia bacterium]
MGVISLLSGTVALANDTDPIEGDFKFETVEKKKKVETPPPAQVESTENDGLRMSFGYPKVDFGFAIHPGQYSLDQTLLNTSSKFNFSQFSFSELKLDARMFLNPRLLVNLDINYRSVAVAAADLNLFQIKESSVSAFSSQAGISYCYTLRDFQKKICPGIVAGVDAYPILAFKNNTDLALDKLNDMSLGLSVYGEAPAGDDMSVRGKASYTKGLKQGQASGYTMKSDGKFSLSGEILRPFGKQFQASLGLGLEKQSATFTRLQDNWEMSNLNYALSIGVRYNLYVTR